MALTSVKASTQDAGAGTPVATALNEDDGTKALQAMALVGNKTTYAESTRTGLTTADAPAGGNLTTTGFAGNAGANLTDMGNALALALRASCDTAGKVLSGRVVFYDAANACLSLSETVTFASDPTLRLGNAAGDFVAPRVVIDAGAARKFRFLVDSVSGGTWTVSGRPV